MPVRRSSEPEKKPTNGSSAKPAASSSSSSAAIPVARQTEAERREQMERVMRLKAQRAAERAEKMEKEGKTPKKKPATPRKKTTTTSSSTARDTNTSATASNTSTRRGPGRGASGGGRVYEAPPAKPRKKMSFKELMQEADNIKADDLKIGIKVAKRRRSPKSGSGRKELADRESEKLVLLPVLEVDLEPQLEVLPPSPPDLIDLRLRTAPLLENDHLPLPFLNISLLRLSTSPRRNC